MPLVTQEVSEIKPGQLLKGPDYYKSSQSGHQPVLYRAMTGSKPFIVCRLADLEEAKRANLRSHTGSRTSTSSLGYPIHYFARWDAATTKFRAMCLAQVEMNRQLHQRHLLTRPAPVRRQRTRGMLVG